MPELPDVEVFKKYIDATSLHQKVANVAVLNTKVLKSVSKGQLTGSLKGRRFESTQRRGKFLLVETDGRPWLVLHFGMTGNLKYYKSDNVNVEYARVRIDFQGGGHLAYISQRMLGKVNLAESFEQFVEDRRLGPDALAIDRDTFKETLGRSHAAVKSVLMNQKYIAGIGNIYSDEILFQSEIHPETPADELNDKQYGRIYNRMRTVLKTAIRHDADPQDLPRSYLLPVREKGGACPRCGGKIATIKVGQRTSYFCPQCQSD